MKCDCENFEEGYKKINGFINLQQIREYGFNSPGEDPRYQFIPWVYCPWCGEKLKGEEG